MAKKNEKELAVVTANDYAILKMDRDALPTVLRDNCGAGGIDQFDLDRISMPAGGGTQWSVPTLDGSDEDVDHLEGVVVLFQDGRAMWRESFDEAGGGSPPDCSSGDGVTGIGDPGGPCVPCPLSQYGSGKDNSQQCKSMRLLYLIRPGAILPLVVALPPTSLKPARKYFMRLTSLGVPYHSVITRIGLAKDKNAKGISYSKASFAMSERIAATESERFAELNKVFAEVFKNVPIVDASSTNN